MNIRINNNLQKIKRTEVFRVLQENNLINETALRNLELKEEYFKRVKGRPGKKRREIREEMAAENSMDRKTLEKVLYPIEK